MRKFLLFSTFFVVSTKLFACDICGCSSAMNYYGILPQFHKNFVGARYYSRAFNSTHPPSIIYSGDLKSDEHYKTVDFWARFYPFKNKKTQTFVFVPINYFKKFEDKTSTTNSGLGDISLTTNYTLINSGDSLFKKTKHTWLIGGGVKLPSGKYKPTIANPNMQLGSGSFDFIVNTIYTIRYNKLGLNTEATFKLNGKNKNNYRFGNRFSISESLFYWKRFKKISWMPHCGAIFEIGNKDKSYNITQSYTGGYSSFASFGSEFYLTHFSFGASYQHPISQNLFEGYTSVKNRLIINLIYLF